MSSSHILNINTYQIHGLQIFSPFHRLFYFVVFLAVQKFVWFLFSVPLVYFFISLLMIYRGFPRKHYKTQCQGDFFFLCFLLSFMLSGHRFKSLIHFELIFV